MELKTIRFKTGPRIAHKRNSIFPDSKYYNKLHNTLKIYTKQKNIEHKYLHNNLNFPNDEIFKNEINDVFIKTQCKLHNLPLKLYGNKYIETDYLEPYWDEFSIENSPKYVLVSKKYALINEIDAYYIIEQKNVKKYFENESKVKVHKVILPQGYSIIFE